MGLAAMSSGAARAQGDRRQAQDRTIGAGREAVRFGTLCGQGRPYGDVLLAQPDSPKDLVASAGPNANAVHGGPAVALRRSADRGALHAMEQIAKD